MKQSLISALLWCLLPRQTIFLDSTYVSGASSQVEVSEFDFDCDGAGKSTLDWHTPEYASAWQLE
jgi:hypothetical protein